MLDEVKNDVLHILIATYVYQQRVPRIVEKSATRWELCEEFVLLDALVKTIVLGISRLADKRRDVRSLKNAIKKAPLNENPANKDVVDKFVVACKPVLEIRHKQLAHMKPGDFSNQSMPTLPQEVTLAVNALVNAVDRLNGKLVPYQYRVGSQELPVDLRAAFDER